METPCPEDYDAAPPNSWSDGTLVHHVRKADGALADSRDIAASVDMIVSFTLGDVRTRRVLRYEGRWPLETRTLDFNTRTRRYAVADSVTESEGNYDEDDIA